MWICEHRWRQIYSMVQFRSIVGDNSSVENWWDNGAYQIAFSRGNKAFVAFNLESDKEFRQRLQTGLPSGIYCDIISGEIKGNITWLMIY